MQKSGFQISMQKVSNQQTFVSNICDLEIWSILDSGVIGRRHLEC